MRYGQNEGKVLAVFLLKVRDKFLHILRFFCYNKTTSDIEGKLIYMFVHLHNHSEYSMLDSTARVDDLIAKAVSEGAPAVAITDHGNLHGAFEFYKKCKKKNIKPIIGCEFYTVPDVHEKSQKRNHLILLAKDKKGYYNLVKLASEASKYFYYKPVIDRELLRQYHEGLVCLSACIQGEIPRVMLEKGYEAALEVAKEFQAIFGEDFYIEVQDHGLKEEFLVKEQLLSMAKELGTLAVCTNDIHYIEKEDAEAQDVLLCIGTKSKLSDENRLSFDVDEFYYKTEAEMEKLFPRECLDASLVIADKCNAEIESGLPLAPHFPRVPEGHTETSYLRQICEDELAKKYSDNLEEATKRMNYELGVIEKMDYSGYFLIVWDFIRYAKEHDIAIGPGRGSAVGSIVCYLTGITALEPMRYGLLFERFLNPERVSMPDIDSDISNEDRKKIVQYMIDTYGADNSAQIATFGREAPKAAIRDVCRVLGMSFEEAGKLASFMPSGPHTKIKDALENVELKAYMEASSAARKAVEFAMKLEGLPRQTGTHAAGLVICRERLDGVIPVTYEADGLHAQYNKDDVEEIGLLKMDLLGLKNLSIIEGVKRIVGRDVLDNIPLDDEKTMNMLCKGATFGVFQLESSGITDIVRKIAPREFKDLIPIMALYRPGPLGSGMVDDFCKRCRGEEEIKYPHPCLEDVLKETFGVILYQEQVMKVVQVMAGFSLGRSDLVRRAMGKKKEEILKAQRDDFVAGCKGNNIDEETANKVFDLLMFFANYGFNKSHSAVYGYISYITAYLKAHYTAAYMVAYANAYIDREDKLAKVFSFCRAAKIDILIPDVSYSEEGFTVRNGKIIMGLSAVKGLSGKAINDIIGARPFKNVADLVMRTNVSKKDFIQLAKAGAFDSICKEQGTLVFEGEQIFAKLSKLRKSHHEEMASLFGEEAEDLPAIRDISSGSRKLSLMEKLDFEKEILGGFISANPLDSSPDDVRECYNLERKKLREGRNKFIGIVSSLRAVVTKKGDTMAFFNLSYYSASMECVAFPNIYKEGIADGDIIKFNGKVEKRNDKLQCVINELLPLGEKTKDENPLL